MNRVGGRGSGRMWGEGVGRMWGRMWGRGNSDMSSANQQVLIATTVCVGLISFAKYDVTSTV